jgi:LPXTG-motif cell wall-anchored protein
MTPRRSLTTTTAAAAGALIALCFVPSASATTVAHLGRTAAPASASPAAQETRPVLAETGAMDTTPYLVGGAGFLGVGAILLVLARRRALTLELEEDPEDPEPGPPLD